MPWPMCLKHSNNFTTFTSFSTADFLLDYTLSKCCSLCRWHLGKTTLLSLKPPYIVQMKLIRMTFLYSNFIQRRKTGSCVLTSQGYSCFTSCDRNFPVCKTHGDVPAKELHLHKKDVIIVTRIYHQCFKKNKTII